LRGELNRTTSKLLEGALEEKEKRNNKRVD